MNSENPTKWSTGRKLYLVAGVLICAVALVMMFYPR